MPERKSTGLITHTDRAFFAQNIRKNNRAQHKNQHIDAIKLPVVNVS